MNAPCAQLRSKKVPHCALSIRQDAEQVLHMQEVFPCSCYGSFLANAVGSQVSLDIHLCFVPTFLANKVRYKYLPRPSSLVCVMEQKASLSSNHPIYSVFQR